MPISPAILAAILRFDDWSRPWSFRDAVSASLPAVDSAQFDEVWREAMDTRHWAARGDIAAGTRASAAAVLSRFPQLGTAAADAIARAASYDWR